MIHKSAKSTMRFIGEQIKVQQSSRKEKDGIGKNLKPTPFDLSSTVLRSERLCAFAAFVLTEKRKRQSAVDTSLKSQ